MIDPRRRLHPRAEAALRSRAGRIPGVGVVRLGVAEPDCPPAGNMTRFEAILSCWSPCLNAHRMVLGFDVDPAAALGEQTRAVLAAVEPHLAVQRSRMSAGLALGRAAPFAAGVDDGIEGGHILIDRGLAALMGGPKAARDEVLDALLHLHEDAGTPFMLGGEWCLSGEYEVEGTGDEICYGVRGLEFHMEVRFSDIAVYDGRRLRTDVPLPDTLIAAAPGRLLGTLMEVPAAIAGHMIVGAEPEDVGTDIHLRPDLVRLGELTAGWTGDGT